MFIDPPSSIHTITDDSDNSEQSWQDSNPKMNVGGIKSFLAALH